MDLQPRIDETGKAILIGLKKSGKTKTFSQILEEAGIPFDKSNLLEIANLLEALDLIKSVSYQLPIAIRAELSLQGQSMVKSFQAQSAPTDNSMILKRRSDGSADQQFTSFL
jgi:hypothetical protein